MRPVSKTKRSDSWKLQLKIFPYLMLMPSLVFLFSFVFYPLFSAIPMSLFKWDPIAPATYVGLGNYAQTLKSAEFFAAWGPTFGFIVPVVIFSTILPLSIAILLQRKIILGTFIRASIFFPAVVSMVVVGMLWRCFFTSEYGIINYILTLVGIEPLQWLINIKLALPAVVIAAVWRTIGWNVVIFFAGLQSIPIEYMEAAKTDGASAWQGFWRLTLPLLSPITLFVIITTMINAFKSFDMIYVMTHGGPGSSTTTIMLHLYNIAFVESNLGRANVVGLILFMVVLTMTLIQLRIFKGNELY